MKKEPTFYSVEDNFKQRIDEKLDLWISIVNDSMVENQTKERIREILLNFKNNGLKNSSNLDNAFYDTISSILTITKKEPNKSEAAALFENIRDDIWLFFDELRK